MIASNDTITAMIPPFQITATILEHISKIERLIGRLESLDHPKPQPQLRKSNRVRTVHGSLAIEGNTLSLEQVTALIDGKVVIGKAREIKEILHAIETYSRMSEFDPYASSSLLDAHRSIMGKLIDSAGQWRRGSVGVFQGTLVSHMAPPAKQVPRLMQQLFEFLQKSTDHPLIQSAVFHYELEFIHPFEDGNGRIGRFWHTLLLYHYHPVFEFTPVESLIQQHQQEYYKALHHADQTGDSTGFIEFSLNMIYQSLKELVIGIRPQPSSTQSRLQRARIDFKNTEFSRKDYITLHKTISTATASRDLQAGTDQGMLSKVGANAQTRYRFLITNPSFQHSED